jgi:hypothetical protein
VSNLVPVEKKSGEIRLCVNFQNLNQTSDKDNYPVLVTGKSPCGQVNFLLDLDPYNQDRKVLTLVTDIPLNLAKLIYRKRKKMYLFTMFVLAQFQVEL